jgi:hypothetical protein
MVEYDLLTADILRQAAANGAPFTASGGVFPIDDLAAVAGSSKAPLTENTDFEIDVLAGLSSDAKWLPSKYFYDAGGSALFEQITRIP